MRIAINDKLEAINFISGNEIREPKFQLAKAMLVGRKKKHFSQKQLSELTGVTQADISRYESGEGNPTLDTICHIADGLGMNLKLFFEDFL